MQTLAEVLEALLPHRDKTIVTTNGVFDILHVGHVRYLEAAKAMGDILVVAINSDASVKMNKGPERPFNTAEHRAEVLSALAFVDYVVVFAEKTPVEILVSLRPHIHVKGGDYRLEDLPEKAVVESWGGTVVLAPKIDCMSTTDLAGKIAETKT